VSVSRLFFSGKLSDNVRGSWPPGRSRLLRSAFIRTVCTVVFCLLQVLTLAAAEVDSITPRAKGISLADSRTAINGIFDARLQEGVDNANPGPDELDSVPAGDMCDEETLYHELRKAIFQSVTASLGLKGYGLDKDLRKLLAADSYGVELAESVYRDITYLEGFSLNLKELSRIVNIDGHLIGLDKLGHFFAEGYQYFVLSVANEDAVAWGRDQEDGLFGKVTTGVFSYGDLVANFNGYRFWNRVLAKQPDPLLGWFANLLTGPYVRCRLQVLASIRYRRLIRLWEYDGGFDIGDYVDGAWDEANNCNSYKNEEIAEKVALRSKEAYPDYVCPLDPRQCLAARNKYGSYAVRLLHPACLDPEQPRKDN